MVRGWDFELETEVGPFEFKETFEPPADGRRGEFDLEVSAEGISLIQMPVKPETLLDKLRKPKYAIPAAVVLIGATVGIILATVPAGPALISQSISFTSQPSSPAVGATYAVTAKGGGSGNPVTFTIDVQSSATCSISGTTVTFNQPGACVVNANQAGNAKYSAALQAQQVIAVKLSQTITFTSRPPAEGSPGGTPYIVAATATSGDQVTFSSGSTDVCTVSGSTVTFNQPGTCVIDASQAGDDQYLPAPPAEQDIPVVSSVIA